MRIWIINHYAVPASESGGTRHAVLGRYLHARGHEVTIFASAVPHNQGSEVPLPPGALYVDRDHDGVHFRFIRTTPYTNTLQRFINMMSFRRNVCRATDGLERPDVVIGSCVHLHAADAGLRLARRFHAPFVFEVRDIWPVSYTHLRAHET